MTRAACLGLHVRMLLEEMGLQVNAVLQTDASAALDAATKLSGSRMKHLTLGQTFVRQLVKNKLVSLEKVSSESNVADLLTKLVSTGVLATLMPRTGFGPRGEGRERFNLVEVKRLNWIGNLRNADELEELHRAKQAKAAKVRAVALATAPDNSEQGACSTCPLFQ